jgi:hypothetical protein
MGNPTRRTRTGAVALLIGSFACTESITCDCRVEPQVEIFSIGGAFLIHNRTDEFEATAVVMVKGSLALIDGACEGWTPRIQPGDRLRVPNAAVIGFSADAEAAVIQWCLLEGDAIQESGVAEAPFS